MNKNDLTCEYCGKDIPKTKDKMIYSLTDFGMTFFYFFCDEKCKAEYQKSKNIIDAMANTPKVY